MNISNVKAIFNTHKKDTKKNRKSILMFVLMPLITYVMCMVTKDISEELRVTYICMYLTMHCTLIPIISTATALAQEKESKTLRSLIMNGVKIEEYLLGIGSFTVLVTMLFSLLFVVIGWDSSLLPRILVSGFICSTISTILGLAIGILSANVTSATSLSVVIALPITMISFFAKMNESIKPIASIFYSTQANNLLNGFDHISVKCIIVLMANFILVLGFFFTMYHRKRFE